MSKELIRERILSDARAEADLILSKAEQKSSEIIADAMKLAEKERLEALKEMMKYSLIIISSIPVLVIYPFVQKHFVKGVMIGSVKG